MQDPWLNTCFHSFFPDKNVNNTNQKEYDDDDDNTSSTIGLGNSLNLIFLLNRIATTRKDKQWIHKIKIK